jgi:hypothetical protein
MLHSSPVSSNKREYGLLRRSCLANAPDDRGEIRVRIARITAE